MDVEYKIRRPLEIPKNNLTKVRALVKECCNYCTGECALLNAPCVVSKDEEHINCCWYINAVLPMDRALEETVLLANKEKKNIKYHTKKCKSCGKSFKTVNKTTQMCDKCAKKAERERKKAYKIRQKIK